MIEYYVEPSNVEDYYELPWAVRRLETGSSIASDTLVAAVCSKERAEEIAALLAEEETK